MQLESDLNISIEDFNSILYKTQEAMKQFSEMCSSVSRNISFSLEQIQKLNKCLESYGIQEKEELNGTIR